MEYTWTWTEISGYHKYLTLQLNNINILFLTPHNVWVREIELDSIGTILLDIINYSREWENILDVLLVYVTRACDT